MPRAISIATVLLVLGQSLAAQPLIPIEIAGGLSRPVDIASAGDGSGRLFIVEQNGRIRIHHGQALLATPFLDIDARVGSGGERGLLGIAFHPDYASNGEFFLNYTNNSFDTVIARYRVSMDANIDDPNSEEILLTIAQPFANHNGGQLAFGPDGYLYIGMGDGGGGGDPLNSGQDPLTLLGKMLRIDVDAGSPYAIPPDNPFADTDFTLSEIWGLGLRNPFRFSFDRITGDLFIADVGQDAIEEVHLHRANTPAGENYGWRLMEGSQCFNPALNCNDGTLTLPAFEYSHSAGRCSITGGYRYRGSQLSMLAGTYIYGDFCTGEIFGATENTNGLWQQQVLLDTDLDITSFGEDDDGELYVADLGGRVFALVAPLSISPASGVYFRSQLIDLGAAVRVPGVAVNTVVASLDGTDVSAAFDNCAVSGDLVAGGVTLRCAAVPLDLLQAGDHQFSLQVQLSNGQTVSDSVAWTLLDNQE